jgi:hypothetical protein
MKKILIGMLVLLFVCVSCDSEDVTERGLETIDTSKPYLAIGISFNPDKYEMNMLYPQFAVWLEYVNTSGKTEQQTVYVTRGAGKNQWVWFGGSLVRRPESVPVWYGVKANETDLDIDAVSAATPSSAMMVCYVQVPDNMKDKKISVYSEVNSSFDYNLYYSFHPINGQPSIVWKANLDMSKMANEQAVDAQIVGHGNVWGTDHDIAADVSKCTSSKLLFNFVKVGYFAGAE